jgi:hypothetical protein
MTGSTGFDLVTVVTDLLSKALSTVIVKIGEKIWEKGQSLYKRTLFVNKTQETALSEAIRDADLPGPTLKRLEKFLRSPEAERVVGQLLEAIVIRRLEDYEAGIREEWLQLLAVHLGLEVGSLGEFAGRVFEAIRNSCISTVNDLNEASLWDSYEKSETRRHQLVLNELNGILKNIELLAHLALPEVTTYLEFEAQYRKQVQYRYRMLMPPFWEQAQRIPVGQIYVNQVFESVDRESGLNDPFITGQALLKIARRTVILGNPGGGKTTFARWANYRLAQSYEARLIGGQLLTPVLVKLQDYWIKQSEKNWTIAQYMEAVSLDYQIPVPGNAFEYLLLNGRLAIVLDGLDEVVKVGERQKLVEHIEAFCNRYPATPIIVTSRETGYLQAPLDPFLFEKWRLTNFGEPETRQYVKAVFEAEKDANEASTLAKAFLEKSKSLDELTSNPLILGLMCNIFLHSDIKEFPQKRVEIYEKCATMLFEGWDNQQHNINSIPYRSQLRPALMHTAYWFYTNELLQQEGVSEVRLVQRVTEYLLRKHNDRDLAEEAAQGLVTACGGRTWVFTNIGSGTFKFTHRIFLEYFAALYLAQEYPAPNQLIEVLLPKIKRQSWPTTALLAFQTQMNEGKEVATLLLNRLLNTSSDGDPLVAGNCLLFSAQSLEFLVPPKDIIRRLVKECVDYGMTHKQLKIEQLLHFLLVKSVEENQQAGWDAFEEELLNKLSGTDLHQAISAIELGLTPQAMMDTAHHLPALDESFNNLSHKIWAKGQASILALCPRSKRASLEAIRFGAARVEDYARWHGLDAVYERVAYKMWTRSSDSLIRLLAENLVSSQSAKRDQASVNADLESFYHYLNQNIEPLLKQKYDLGPTIIATQSQPQPKDYPILGHKALWVSFIILAIGLDEAAIIPKNGLFGPLDKLIQMKFEKPAMGMMAVEMNNHKFEAKEAEIVRKWLKGEVNLSRDFKTNDT